jgi:hypothetical protein
MKKDKTLVDLTQFQVQRDTATATDTVREQFLKERNDVDTPEKLRAFIESWRNLWLLQGCEENETNDSETALLEGTYDPEKVLDYKSKAKDIEVTDAEANDLNFGVTCELMLPVPLLMATNFAHYYGVGSDLGLVRLFLDPYDPDRKLRR